MAGEVIGDCEKDERVKQDLDSGCGWVGGYQRGFRHFGGCFVVIWRESVRSGNEMVLRIQRC